MRLGSLRSGDGFFGSRFRMAAFATLIAAAIALLAAGVHAPTAHAWDPCNPYYDGDCGGSGGPTGGGGDSCNAYYDSCDGQGGGDCPAYYYDSTYCQVTGQSAKKTPFVSLDLGKRCKTHAVKVKPVFGAGTVLWVSLWAAGKKIGTEKYGPFAFKIGVGKLKSHKKYNVKLVTSFTTSETYKLTAQFKKCG